MIFIVPICLHFLSVSEEFNIIGFRVSISNNLFVAQSLQNHQLYFFYEVILNFFFFSSPSHSRDTPHVFDFHARCSRVILKKKKKRMSNSKIPVARISRNNV
uniref:Uncharacterized protein n=1 Tax=Cacopsylla melanoneura TaxID=428564 RepID=A0A8D9EF20_9HEMI